MEIEDLPVNKKIILFDGVCNLCNSSVQFVIQHDAKDSYRFVSLQSELGQKIILYIGVSDLKIDSIILYISKNEYYLKSEAALKIIKGLDGAYRFLGVFSILPKSLLNSIYDYVAKNRYHWFGKQESCMIPTQELQSKFLQ